MVINHWICFTRVCHCCPTCMHNTIPACEFHLDSDQVQHMCRLGMDLNHHSMRVSMVLMQPPCLKTWCYTHFHAWYAWSSPPSSWLHCWRCTSLSQSPKTSARSCTVTCLRTREARGKMQAISDYHTGWISQHLLPFWWSLICQTHLIIAGEHTLCVIQ